MQAAWFPRGAFFALGAALLFGYGLSLNLVPIEFSRVVGLYVAILLSCGRWSTWPFSGPHRGPGHCWRRSYRGWVAQLLLCGSNRRTDFNNDSADLRGRNVRNGVIHDRCIQYPCRSILLLLQRRHYCSAKRSDAKGPEAGIGAQPKGRRQIAAKGHDPYSLKGVRALRCVNVAVGSFATHAANRAYRFMSAYLRKRSICRNATTGAMGHKRT